MVTQPHYQPSKLKALPRQQQRQVSSADVIACGISTLFHNKENHAETRLNRKTGETSNKWAFGFSFYPQSITVDNLVKHILKRGGAFTPGSFMDRRRVKSQFVSSQILALDIDNTDSVKNPDGTITEFCRTDGYASYEDICNDPFVKQYAALVYPSPSSKPGWDKTRVLFVLSEPVTSANRWEALQRGLLREFSKWHPDKACKDSARLFYGSTNSIHQPVSNPAARLPIDTAAALTLADAVEYDTLRGAGEQLPTVELTGTRREKYAQKALDRIAADIAGAVADRHNAIINGGYALMRRAAGGWFSYADAENAIRQAANANGYTVKAGIHEIERLIEDARRYGQSNPKALTVPADDKKKSKRRRKNDSSSTSAPDLDTTDTRLEWTPVTLATLESAERANVQYLNELDLTGTDDLLIKSDTGTGKTTAIAELVKDTNRLLAVNHRRALSANLAAVLNTENYEGLEAADLRSLSRLSICLNSLPKLTAPDVPLVMPDVLMLDEIAQNLAHIFSDTFRGYEAQQAYNTLTALVKGAGRVIGMDAYLDPLTVAWVKELRQGKTVRVIENTYTRQKGSVTMYTYKDSLIAHGVEMIRENSGKPVVFAVAGTKTLEALDAHLAALFGREHIISIYQDTPDPIAQQHFINHADTEISKYKAVIYSPTLGSGVDIQTPVRAVLGIFHREPLDATEIHQMLNRCRNAGETCIYVENIPANRTTDTKVLFNEAWEKAHKTGAYFEIDGDGVYKATDTQKSLLRLASHITAQQNTSKNNLYAHVMTLARGYESITYNTSEPPAETTDTLKAIKAELADAKRELTLTAEPIDRETLDTLVSKNQATHTHRAGFLRWQIEQSAGVDITPELYDRLHKPDAMNALKLLARVRFASAREMTAKDMSRKGMPLTKWRHYRQRWTILRRVIVAMFGSVESMTPDAVFTETQLAEIIPAMVSTDELKKYFDKSRVVSPVADARFLFKQIGLTLAGKRIRHPDTKERQTVYSLDASEWTVMDALSITSRQRMELDAIRQQQKADEKRGAVQQTESIVCPQNDITTDKNSAFCGHTTESDGAAVQPELRPIGSQMQPMVENRRHYTEPLHLPTKGSGSSINPFSSGFNPAVVEQINTYNHQHSEPDSLGVPKSIGGKAALAARLKGVKRCET